MKHKVLGSVVQLEPAVFERFNLEKEVYVTIPTDKPDNLNLPHLEVKYNPNSSSCADCAFHSGPNKCHMLVCERHKRLDRVPVIFKKVLDYGVWDD